MGYYGNDDLFHDMAWSTSALSVCLCMCFHTLLSDDVSIGDVRRGVSSAGCDGKKRLQVRRAQIRLRTVEWKRNPDIFWILEVLGPLTCGLDISRCS